MINKSGEVESGIKPENDESSESFMTRAANVLTSLSEGIHSLTDIAKRCNISSSTAHRLLATLAKPGLVIYDPINHRYYLGSRVSQLTSNPVTSHQYLIIAANNEMQRLSNLVEETVTLSLMLGVQYIPLHSVYSSHRLIVLEEFRGLRPVEPVGATDIILLSQLDEKDVRRALKIGNIWRSEAGLPDHDTGYWVKELQKTRQAGFTVTRGQKVPGGLGISAPVTNYFCPVALTVIGPEYRLEPRLSDLVKEIKQSANKLSDILVEVFPVKEL